MKKKAQAFTWLYTLFVIFAMALVYIVLDQPYQKISDVFQGNFTGTAYEPTYNKIQTIWTMWLLIFLIGVLIWGVLTALRRQYDSPY